MTGLGHYNRVCRPAAQCQGKKTSGYRIDTPGIDAQRSCGLPRGEGDRSEQSSGRRLGSVASRRRELQASADLYSIESEDLIKTLVALRTRML